MCTARIPSAPPTQKHARSGKERAKGPVYTPGLAAISFQARSERDCGLVGKGKVSEKGRWHLTRAWLAGLPACSLPAVC